MNSMEYFIYVNDYIRKDIIWCMHMQLCDAIESERW